MNEILIFSEALRLLKEKEIIYTKTKGKITYYYLNDDKITIKAISYHSTIPYKDFIDLYRNEEFYLYLPKDENVNLEKDEEYYSWKSKNAN